MGTPLCLPTDTREQTGLFSDTRLKVSKYRPVRHTCVGHVLGPPVWLKPQISGSQPLTVGLPSPESAAPSLGLPSGVTHCQCDSLLSSVPARLCPVLLLPWDPLWAPA